MVQPIRRQLDLPSIPSARLRLCAMPPDVSLTPPSRRAPSARARTLLAALAALAYPGLLWCGVRLSPAFVVLSLAVPLLGLVAAGSPAATRTPATTAIAHMVVAAPPLFSLLGG
jgi:hypothetical protein